MLRRTKELIILFVAMLSLLMLACNDNDVPPQKEETGAQSQLETSSTREDTGEGEEPQFELITPENLEDYLNALLDENSRDMHWIYEYVRDNYEYHFRPKSDVDDMACRMLNYGSGACWDYAALTYKMLTVAGYHCRVVAGQAWGEEHNWLLIEIEPGVWRHLDTSRRSAEIYLLTDFEMDNIGEVAPNQNYEWDHNAYPVAE